MSIFKTATRRKPLWVPQGSSAIRKFNLNSVMIQKKELILSHTQENVDIMTSRLTWDIFITKDAIWDGMFPLLLILSKCELGAWNKFISWTFLYLETFLLRRTLFKTVRCCSYRVRLCLELNLSHEKNYVNQKFTRNPNDTIVKPLLSPQTWTKFV